MNFKKKRKDRGAEADALFKAFDGNWKMDLKGFSNWQTGKLSLDEMMKESS